MILLMKEGELGDGRLLISNPEAGEMEDQYLLTLLEKLLGTQNLRFHCKGEIKILSGEHDSESYYPQ